MKSFRTKLIASVLAFAIGITAYLIWNSRRSHPELQNPSEMQSPAIPQTTAEARNVQDAAPASAPPLSPIRRIDFHNFTFPRIGKRGNIRIRDGKLEYETENCLHVYLVQEIDYLDFTGDGEDEALVRLGFGEHCGSSWSAMHYYIYTMRNGRLRLLWKFAEGSEAHGGSRGETRLENRELIFELYGKWRVVRGEARFYEDRSFTGDSNPTHYSIIRYAWNGRRFRPRSVEVLPLPQGFNIYASGNANQ